MESRKPQEIAQVMEQRASGDRLGVPQQLVFDPVSGQLVVTDRPSPDAVVASQTTDDGYFGYAPWPNRK